jgi:hypothetical protein
MGVVEVGLSTQDALEVRVSLPGVVEEGAEQKVTGGHSIGPPEHCCRVEDVLCVGT